ncbi:MAG: hypothetical protein LBV74_04965 [Tannerella sp.]|jgi:hypothetical protein|nr:hypothetical protein [Tannerella sp.]
MKKINLSLLCLTMLFSACNENYKPTTQEKSIDSGVLEFTYNGVFYSSTYDVTIDSTIIIYDENTNAVYQKLSNNPGLAIFESGNGSIEYFDSFTAMRIAKNIPDQNTISTRSFGPPYPLLEFKFFDFSNFAGAYLAETDPLFDNNNEAELTGTRWDNVMSSIKLDIDFSNTRYKKCLVTIYRYTIHNHPNGATRTFELNLSETSYRRAYLRDIHFKVGNSWIDWNDEISSISYYFDPS